MEGIQLARAYVEFESNFREVIDEQKKVVRASEKAHKSMQSHIKDTVSSWLRVQEETKNTAKKMQSMESSGSSAFRALARSFSVFTKVLSFGVGMLGRFNKLIITVARTGFAIFRRSLQAVIALINQLTRIILELVKRLSQLFTYIATLPVRVVLAVNHARKSLAKWLDDLTKKFVFLQLDIRHVMHLMQRFLLVTVGAMGGATAAAARFEDQFVVVRRVTDMTAEAYDELERRLRSTASEIGRSAVELAELASVAGRLGIEGVENLERFSRIMGQLGVATVLHGEKSATEFARLMTVMNVAERDMNRLASTIVQLGNQFAAFEDEILAMSLQLAGAGAAIGVTVQEILGLATAMAAVDIRVERGGSAMSRVMIEVANAVTMGGEALKTFAELSGMTADTFVETFRRDPMRAIFGFLQGLAEMQELPFQTLQDLNLAQIRTRDVVLRLLSAQEQLGRSLESSAAAWDENIALQREYAVAMDTVIAQGRKLLENVIELTRRVGDLFADELKEAIKTMIEYVQILQAVDEEVYRAIAGLLTLVSVVVGASAVILTLARGFFTLMTAAVLVARVFLWLGTVLAAALIARRIMTFFTDTMDLQPIQLAIEMFEALKGAIDSLTHAFVESDLGNIITQAFRDIRHEWEQFRLFVGRREDIEREFERELSELEWMVRIATEFFNTIKNSMTIVSEMISDIRELISDPDYSLWQDLTAEQRLELTPEQIHTHDAIRSMAQAFREMLSAAFQLTFRDIPGLFADAMTELVFPQIWERMEGEEGWMAGATDRILGWAETMDEWSEAIRQHRPDEPFFPDEVGDLLSAIWELGKSAGALFWEGVKWAFDAVGGPGITESFVGMLEDIADFIWGIEWDALITFDQETREIEFHWDTLKQERAMNEALSGFVTQAIRIYTGMLYQTFMALIHIPPWYKVGILIADGLLRAIAFLIPGLTMGFDVDEGFQSEFDAWGMLREMQEGFDFSTSAYGWMFRFLRWLPFIPEGIKDAADEFYNILRETSDDAEEFFKRAREYLEAVEIFDDDPAWQIEDIYDFEGLSEEIEGSVDAFKKVPKEFQQMIADIRQELGVELPSTFYIALAQMESDWDMYARGDDDTAFGALQVRDPAAEQVTKWFGEEFDITDPVESIKAGMLYAAGIYDVYGQHLTKQMKEHYDEVKTKMEAVALLYRGPERFARGFARGTPVILDEIDLTRLAIMRMYSFASGGLLSGYGGGDTIPALLEAGEAIVPKEAVRAGAGGIASWFKSQGVPGFQDGGIVDDPGFFTRMFDTIGERMQSLEESRDMQEYIDMGFEWSQNIVETIRNLDLSFEGIVGGIESMTGAIYDVGDRIIVMIGGMLDRIIQFASFFLDLTEEQEDWLTELRKDITGLLENILRRFEPDQPIDVMTGAAPLMPPKELFKYMRIDESPAWEATEGALRRFIIRTNKGGKRLTAIMQELGVGFNNMFQSIRQYLIGDPLDEDEAGVFGDEIEMLSGLIRGARQSFEELTQTRWGRELANWLRADEHLVAQMVNDFARIPGIAIERMREGWNRLGEMIDSLEQRIGVNFGEMAINASEVAGALGGVVTGMLPLITQSEVWARLMDIIGGIFQAIANTLGMFLEPFLAIANTLSMVLLPILEVFGTILSTLLVPVMKPLFHALKYFGIFLISVAMAVAAVWNALIWVVSRVIRSLRNYRIDIDELRKSRQELIDLTWEEALARDQVTDELRTMEAALRNVPSAYAVALRRFQAAAQGMERDTRRRDVSLLPSIDSTIRDIYALLIERLKGEETMKEIAEKSGASSVKKAGISAGAGAVIGGSIGGPVGAVAGALIGGFASRFLASGGIAMSPMSAIIGEKGPEVVAPLDRLPDLIGRVVTGGGNTYIIIEGDVYGYEDFADKVYESYERKAKDKKGSKYGVGTRTHGRR